MIDDKAEFDQLLSECNAIVTDYGLLEWKYAEKVYTIYKHPRFRKYYGKLQALASDLGLSDSRICQLCKAYERSQLDPYIASLTVGQVIELSPIPDSLLLDFVLRFGITRKSSIRFIRECCKIFKEKEKTK